MSGFRARDATIYRPYADEVPWELLAAEGTDEDALAAVLELDLVRVAKFEGRVVGAYGIRPVSATRFELVALRVVPTCQRRGLGRWLLGHAIGLCEAKGAREILVRGQRQRVFLERFDFRPAGTDLLLTLTPE